MRNKDEIKELGNSTTDEVKLFSPKSIDKSSIEKIDSFLGMSDGEPTK